MRDFSCHFVRKKTTMKKIKQHVLCEKEERERMHLERIVRMWRAGDNNGKRSEMQSADRCFTLALRSKRRKSHTISLHIFYWMCTNISIIADFEGRHAQFKNVFSDLLASIFIPLCSSLAPIIFFQVFLLIVKWYRIIWLDVNM